MVNAGNFDWHKKKRSYWEQFAKDKVKKLLKDESHCFQKGNPCIRLTVVQNQE